MTNAKNWVDRLFGNVATLIGSHAARTDRFGIAVSGGPDSMALLAIAADALPSRVMAATVDHRLRPEAADEAMMVKRWCGARGIAHETLTPAQPITGNLQSAAREARYALLEEWRNANALDWILTAHHADDQAETLLMRLNRGSGVGGLAGVRASNGRVLRPVLGWRRAELAEAADDYGLPTIDDPSNSNPRFDRVRMRAILSQIEWIDVDAVARSAAALAQAHDALDWTTRELAAGRLALSEEGSWVLDPSHLPAELRRRLLVRALTSAAPDMAPPRGETIDKAIVQLLAGKKTMIGDLLLEGGGRWTVRAAPERKNR